MTSPPKLPLAPATYDRSVMDRMIRSIEQYLEVLSRPRATTATSLRVTDLVGASTLNAGILAGATSLTLVDATNFPTSGEGTVNAEKFSWSGKTGNTLNNLVRGIVGTTAASHLAGDVVIASAVRGSVYADPTTNALYVVV